MRQKLKVLATIVAILCIAFVYANMLTSASTSGEKNKAFVVAAEGKVGNYADQLIMYDPDTKVMYVYLDGHDAGTMSVLYNADGTVKSYSSDAKTLIVVAEEKVGNYADQLIMYDPDTKVIYAYLDGHNAGTMSVMYNADGTLKTYSPER